MRIATWNINSVRLRLGLVERLLDTWAPDVLCLQEIKVINGLFPVESFKARGYHHLHVKGMKGYNGVALISRLPLTDCGARNWCDLDDSRHIFAKLPNGVELHNFYIPSGGDVPDPEQNSKFANKLRFVDEMTSWWGEARGADRPMIAVGDFNIAPLPQDVWNHKALLDVVSHTPAETTRLEAMRQSIDWVDSSRYFVPETEKLYTWWSYRAKDWQAANRGRRLDHIWVTQPLKPLLRSHFIVQEARGWEPKPSDHVPVILDLEI
jgi:exodeoxyribonuclease III